MKNTIKKDIRDEVIDVIVELTDITGYDHTKESDEAFHKSVDKIIDTIDRVRDEEREEAIKIINNSPLAQLLRYAFTKGSGHTYAEVMGVRNVPNAILVVKDENQKANIKDVPRERIVAITGDTHRFFAGRRHPVVIDHFVVQSEIEKILQSLYPYKK